MRRLVEPELLDGLPSADPQAVGSRADLRRLNYIMSHAGILSRALRPAITGHSMRSRSLRIVELGAGDGTLMLRLAQRWAPPEASAQVTFIDQQDLVSPEMRRAFAALNWSVTSVATDVFTWLEQAAPAVDVMLANLFLHHFQDERLGMLLRLASVRTNLFVACEPRRSPLALNACRLLWLIGCNRVTQHDAAVSVRAGFSGRELSALWPTRNEWVLNEQPAGLFSHCFVAQRNA